MTTASVVISFEFAQLPRQIDCIPEEHAIKNLAPNRADQSFDERMRDRDVRNRLHLVYIEHTQVGEPPVKAKQRIVVGTQVFQPRLARSGVIEHPANRSAINGCRGDAKTDDAAGEHVHHHPASFSKTPTLYVFLKVPSQILMQWASEIIQD